MCIWGGQVLARPALETALSKFCIWVRRVSPSVLKSCLASPSVTSLKGSSLSGQLSPSTVGTGLRLPVGVAALMIVSTSEGIFRDVLGAGLRPPFQNLFFILGTKFGSSRRLWKEPVPYLLSLFSRSVGPWKHPVLYYGYPWCMSRAFLGFAFFPATAALSAAASSASMALSSFSAI